MPTPSYHHGHLRDELLALAERRIEEAGVPGLSLRELAREIGVSHGAPRQHFPDKQALLDALAVRGLDELGSRLDADLALRDGASFADRLLAFASDYVEFAAARPVLLGLMFTRKDDSPTVRAANDRAFGAPRRSSRTRSRPGRSQAMTPIGWRWRSSPHCRDSRRSSRAA
jgi:AcrR family transcriptional regulator